MILFFGPDVWLYNFSFFDQKGPLIKRLLYD